MRPVGGDRELPFDARLVAATNRDLDEMVEEDSFRKDLYYRINVIEIEVPPLRARGNDILLLAHHFLTAFADRSGKGVTGLSKGVADKLLSYHWPGNVRELKNAMERAVALTRSELLSVDDLPEKIRQHRPEGLFTAGHDPSDLVSLETLERRYILHALKVLGENRTRAANVLGCDRKTLYRKLKAYGVDSD